jgi:mannose-6-phosphate isomerase-like protein (cupin superfamily)
MKQGKIWGKTECLLQNSFVEFHRIDINQGTQCSMHKHEHKWNAFYVVSGELDIEVRKNNYDLTDTTKLMDGDFTTVTPGEYHRFVAHTDVVAFEIYYPEGLTEDIVRESVGGQT